jgi:hypothetical protein
VPSLGSGGVLARLDGREMVLPANISTTLQSVTASYGSPRGGGNVSYSSTINARGSAMTHAQFGALLSRDSDELIGMAAYAFRNGWP